MGVARAIAAQAGCGWASIAMRSGPASVPGGAQKEAARAKQERLLAESYEVGQWTSVPGPCRHQCNIEAPPRMHL